MKKDNVSVVPVVKNNTNELVGILTRSDVINNPDEDQIVMLMTRDVITTTDDACLSEVSQKMVENNIRRMPVVDDDGNGLEQGPASQGRNLPYHDGGFL